MRIPIQYDEDSPDRQQQFDKIVVWRILFETKRKGISLEQLSLESTIPLPRLQEILYNEAEISLEEIELMGIGVGLILFEVCSHDIPFTYSLTRLDKAAIDNIVMIEWSYDMMLPYMPIQGEITSVEDLLWEVSLNREVIVTALTIFEDDFYSEVIEDIKTTLG